MKNLEKDNILVDYGESHISIIENVESMHNVKLPVVYVDFIIKHNGASLNRGSFDFDNTNRTIGIDTESIAFIKAERIQRRIENIKSDESPDDDPNWRFEDGLIPFGDNGGGDLICFDYRNNRDTDNPPIVIWNHDMGFDHRVVFVANNFEEFINMLHEPEY